MTSSTTHVILGAGHAAGCAVREMRSIGFGGRIVLIGAEPTLPYERPPLSKEVLLGTAALGDLLVNKASFYDEQEVELWLARTAIGVDAADRVVRCDDGSSISYDRLLISTGSRPRRIEVPGAHLPGVHYLRTLADAAIIADQLISGNRMVVIGAGLIGLEVAAVARQRGMDVIVVEASSGPMSRVLQRPIADVITRRHRERGVEFHFDCAVREIGRAAGRLSVSCTARDLPADIVVVGIGALPNAELAGAAGLAVDNGILVNEFCETSGVGIYAAGDVTCFFSAAAGRAVRLESWQNAQDQAAAAARVMCGQRASYESLPYNWSHQFDMNIQVAGFADAGAKVALRGSYRDDTFVSLYLKDARVVGAVALNNSRDFRAVQHLIMRRTDISGVDLSDQRVSLKSLALRSA